MAAGMIGINKISQAPQNVLFSKSADRKPDDRNNRNQSEKLGDTIECVHFALGKGQKRCQGVMTHHGVKGGSKLYLFEPVTYLTVATVVLRRSEMPSENGKRCSETCELDQFLSDSALKADD